LDVELAMTRVVKVQQKLQAKINFGTDNHMEIWVRRCPES
jgi:hypothetical protein